ncbi:MAG: magnesium-translocating P-type ATPase [Candidatus Freyarchaeum deiterrae]
MVKAMNGFKGSKKASTTKSSSQVQLEKGTEEQIELPINNLFANLKTSQSGLTSQEVEKRLELYGHNEIAKRKKRTAVAEFASHFRNPLIIILLIAGLVSVFFQQVINAVIIFAIVLLSVVLDFYQESRAEKAAEMLKEKVTTTATVLRNGVKKEVKLSEIVPGDIVYLSAGDIVPADARVIESKDFFLNQSSLTGESFPVEKTAAPSMVKCETVTERSNYLFLGTSVVSGTATAVVVKTGSFTEYGKIAKKLVARQPETEYERGLRRFGFLIMEITFFLVVFVFFVNTLLKGQALQMQQSGLFAVALTFGLTPDLLQGILSLSTQISGQVLQSLLFSVALAVGLTPELLPMILSVNLSKAGLAMSRKGVIVKRLASIQNFGSMDVLCTDKTGTLTENKVTLLLHVDFEGNEDEKVLLYSFLNSYYQTGLKSPLDEAILRHENVDVTAKGYQKIDEVPFDFIRKRISVVVEQRGQRFLITKGAPDEIIKVCSYCELADRIVDMTSDLQRKIEQKYFELSSDGFRVLGISYKSMKEEKQACSVSDESGMVFLGYVVFLDPPKKTVKKSLQLLSKAGVELKICTGDNEIVTKKVCEQLDFEVKGIVLGSDIVGMPDDALAVLVENSNVFARVTPQQKDRIMNVLKSNGHVVGFLGDGINDAPSLRTADVGISVNNAVDIAKESADIILSRKDLTVLVEGVIEGRKTFGNTLKYILMGSSSNFGNMFSCAGASLFLPFLPMTPIQILLNNFLYDLSETTIPTDNVDAVYTEKPRRWNISFIRKFMLLIGPMSSIYDFLTFFIMLNVFAASQSLFQTGWFIESLCTQTLVIFVIRTTLTPFFKSKPSKLLTISSLAVVGFALIIPFTPLGALFGFAQPPLLFYIILAGLVGSYLLLVETIKKWFYKRYALT